MRSAATIAMGNVMVIVSPPPIFPLDGSMAIPPASGFAFDTSSSSCWSALARANARAGRANATPQTTKKRMTVENRGLIGALREGLGSGEDPHPPHLSFRYVVRIALVRSMQQTTR